MSDKEPRRRKKRKDLQAARKEDIRPEDLAFLTSRSDSKDSDQETDDEGSTSSHHPTFCAKFVFFLLFSSIVVSLSFIFISLHGTKNNEIESFDHTEELNIQPEIHDEHINEESPSEVLEDFFPAISKFFFNLGNAPEADNESEKTDARNVEDMSETAESVYDDKSVDEAPSETFTETFTSESIPLDMLVDAPENVNDDDENVEGDYAREDIISTEPLDTMPHIFKVTESEQESSENAPNTSGAEESWNHSEIMEEPEDFDVPPTHESEYDLGPETVRIDQTDILPVAADEDEFQNIPVYENADITDEADFEIRDQLDEIDSLIEKFPEKALKRCEELLHAHTKSPRLHYSKAAALDRLAESQRSNKLLEESISVYQEVMSLSGTPQELYLRAGKKAADRMRFRGFMGKSLKLLSEMSVKFPNDVSLKNLVAVGFLFIGQNSAAKKELESVLKLDPNQGFAKVHLGFILKTDESKYEEAIKLMSEGIASKEPGVVDGRFYFHLGDALHRVGRQNEALKVYEEAVSEGLFLSTFQRSLYNVNGLTGKPWWEPDKTIYAQHFKTLENNWETIRNEALAIIDKRNSGFLPEAEGLQEKGDWKQFELFARGRKIDKNCAKVPKTCELISQMPDAANCKRGQAKFSIMHPATHVWAHTGPTNCRLRSHLGLVVPPGVSIRVATEVRNWKEGKILLFDDSFEHEVWHNGNSSRLILIVDFWHPELTATQKRSLTPI